MKTIKIILIALIVFASMQSQAQSLSDNLLLALEQSKTETSRIAGKTITRSCISDLISQAKKHWAELTPKAQEAFKIYTNRPILSGTELIYPSQWFDIHYTLTGADHILATDGDANGTPDYIDNMAFIFDNVWNEYMNRGYGMPPQDAGMGGTNYYDVYVHNIGITTYGYVSPETVIGDNPNSAQSEVDAATSWMGMNTTYSWVSGGLSSMDAIKVTAAHEFFHAVQDGITTSNTNFISEATAAWAEDEIYPNIDDNIQYLPEIFNTPDVALNWNRDYDANYGQQFSGHWYGAWIFFRYLTEQTNPSIIKDIWNGTITYYEMGSIDNELGNWGTNLESMYHNFLISCDVLSDNASYGNYTFNKANTYANSLTNNKIKYEAEWLFYGVDINLQVSNQTNVGNSRLMRLSADYFKMTAVLDFSLKLIPQNSGSHIKFMLLKYDSIAGTVEIANSFMNGDTLQINVGNNNNFTNYTAIVYRDDYVMNNLNSGASEQYDVFVNYYVGSSNNVAAINNNNDGITIFPNPTTDFIMLSNSNDLESYTIYNSVGQFIKAGKIENKIDLSDVLQGGNYFIVLYYKGDKKTAFKQFSIIK